MAIRNIYAVVLYLVTLIMTLSMASAGFGCTLSCSVWNSCRVVSLPTGDLMGCGPEPSGCNCQVFGW
jgi:hypothetical protein